MRVVERGHVYALSNKVKGEQLLTFFKDLPHGCATNHDGVLCQEVIRALIDRYLDLFGQVPCGETMKIVENLRECLVLGEARAFRRTLEKSYTKTGRHVEQLGTCKNGHLFDFELGDH